MKKYAIYLLIMLSSSIEAQVITSIAGNGISGCATSSGVAISTNISDPLGATFDNTGNYYFANQTCHTVCKIDRMGILSIVAGSGSSTFSGDGGMATSAGMAPNCMVFDHLGNLYIADAENYRIRKIDVFDVITTYAGNGTSGFSGDGGNATAAELNGTNGLCFDKKGNLYISDANNNRIRKIDTAGIITTAVGTGTPGFSGDGAMATAAEIWEPFNVTTDNIGNLYIADEENKRIRRVDTSGIIKTIAGTGITTFNGDSIQATTANIAVLKIAIDSFGNLFVTDGINERIRRIDTFGVVHTTVGNGVAGYRGDGGLTDTAEIHTPSGIATDSCGNIYFGDVGNYRIRKIKFTFNTNIVISGFTSAAISDTITLTASITNPSYHYTITWFNRDIPFATTTVPVVSSAWLKRLASSPLWQASRLRDN